MENRLSKNFWFVIILFSLFGQVAWVVENMYFNVFIYEEFHATPDHIALMVSLSAATATITTLLIGALSDKLGKRKIFICLGYILWGISIMIFALFTQGTLSKLFPGANVVALGISLVIIFDCVMTFFGSTANDACFNAWITDNTNDTNRGKVEGINSIMPLVAILVVFGSFMGVTGENKWQIIFTIIGLVVIVSGIIGFFTIKESSLETKKDGNYFKDIFYGFKPSIIKKNKQLYIILIAYAIFGIAIQTFMPYLILYYDKFLKLENYVLIMAPAIIVASVITALYGKAIDKLGFMKAIIYSLIILMIGLLGLYLFKQTVLVFIFSLFMMAGYLSSCAAFGATVRDHTPKETVGLFQGIRMVAYVLIPMLIGPWIGSSVISTNEIIEGTDGVSTKIPDNNIFLAAFLVSILIWIVLFFINKIKDPKTINLTTKYTDKLDENNPLGDYPRPQLIRDSYLSLNGYFEFEILKENKIPTIFSKKILVPFPVESFLSKINCNIEKGDILCYKKTFKTSNLSLKDKTLLHIDCIDQTYSIYLNNNLIIDNNYSGYLPFIVDIQPFLKETNELIILVKDDLNMKYPYGKQTNKRGGMWYTNFSGIIGSVWLESVSNDYIRQIILTPKYDESIINFSIKSNSKHFDITILDSTDNIIKHIETSSNNIDIKLDNFISWSPENPYLYNVEIKTENDIIKSYFGMRKIEIREVNGIKKVQLNNKNYFFNGLLDQGYYPDGIFLPASYQAYYDDILTMKKLGFNTLRKHIKVEPLIWYSLCDKIGMIVFQDMVNNQNYSFFRDTVLPTIGFKNLKDKNMHASKEGRDIFINHSQKTIEYLYNSPSIVIWTIFNEGWGQFDSKRVYEELKEKDSTRMFDVTSGWFKNFDYGFASEHVYFKDFKIKNKKDPVLLSEFGGYSLKIKDHSFNLDKTYGYRFYNSKKELQDAFVKLYEEQIIPNIKNGLFGSIYTQLSDVEDETNGILTYDRKIVKLDSEITNKLFSKIKID